MNLGAAAIFVVILVLGLFTNKYVLSVLGFRYPTIFQVLVSYIIVITVIILFHVKKINPLPQGWQTLCGLLLYKILTVAAKSNFKVNQWFLPSLHCQKGRTTPRDVTPLEKEGWVNGSRVNCKNVEATLFLHYNH